MIDIHHYLCAVSRIFPLGVSDIGAEDGFATVDDSPIPANGAGFPEGGALRDDEYIDTDDEEGFLCPPCVPEPKEPSPEDVARHNLTHIPYRSWCPHCVAARKNNQAHKQGSSAPRTIPLLVFDYAFIKDADTQEMLTSSFCKSMWAEGSGR